MGSTLKLPCTRFVRQVSNGVEMSKHGYIGMMQQNAEAIKSAKWRKAACSPDDVALTVNKVTETDGAWNSSTGLWTKKSTYSAFCKDYYDCFAQGGDAIMERGTFCGYLGVVAYRFMLPRENPGAIENIKLLIQRDRYLRSGVRVVVDVNSDAEPSDDWAAIRGEVNGLLVSDSTPSTSTGVASWGFLNQSEASCLIESKATDGTLEFSKDRYPVLANTARSKYLWVYMSCEDLAGYWDKYDATEPRYYSIEGSAMLVSGCCAFTFSTYAVAPESPEEPSAEVVFDYVSTLLPYPAAVIPDVMYDEPGCGQEQLYCRFGSFAICSGMSGFIASGIQVGMLGALWDLMSRSSGSLLFDTFDRGKAVLTRNIGSANEWYSPSHMMRFCGIPSQMTAPRGMLVLLRSCSRDSDMVSGYSTGYTSQMFLSAAMSVVPYKRAEYSRIRILSPKFDVSKAVGCRVSVNVWKSQSESFYGGFANVALQTLAANPAFFTGAEKTVAGSASETLWADYVLNGTDYVCKGDSENVTVTANAELIGNASLDDAYDIEDPNSSNMTRALDLTNISIKAGDVLLFTPRIEEVCTDDYTPVAHWGLNTFGKVPASMDAAGALGIQPKVQFA